jgi:phosphatidylethanolamine-binding protein (PEBP) family uncharacterized protein
MNRRRPAGRVLALVVLLGGLVGAGCARNDGRAMTPPPAGAVPPSVTSGEQAGTAASVPTFALSSSAFTNGSVFPADSGCDGAGLPPPLEWTAPPAVAVELALVLTDADDGDAVLWVLAGLPPTEGKVTAGVAPAGAVDLGYRPPCPPPGADPHVLIFNLYALTSPLGIAPGTTPDDAVLRISTSPAQVAQLTAFVAR